VQCARQIGLRKLQQRRHFGDVRVPCGSRESKNLAAKIQFAPAVHFFLPHLKVGKNFLMRCNLYAAAVDFVPPRILPECELNIAREKFSLLLISGSRIPPLPESANYTLYCNSS
jgi:hypothetical protein